MSQRVVVHKYGFTEINEDLYSKLQETLKSNTGGGTMGSKPSGL